MFRKRKPRMRDASDAYRYGFRWDNVDVVRMSEYRGYKCIGVETDFGSVQIYVSPTGQGIRVFEGGRELLPEAS